MTTAHPMTATAQQLLEQGIAAYRGGKSSEAFYLIAQSLQHNPQLELGWIWLSATLSEPAQRRFCLERALAINPQNEAVIRGLQRMPADLQAQSPFPARRNERGQDLCTFPGCQEVVSRAGHSWCYQHWKVFRSPQNTQRPTINQTHQETFLSPDAQKQMHQKPSQDSLLSATLLAERLDLRDRGVNKMLADLGWIMPDRQGWVATERGKEVGAVQRYHAQQGTPYLLWPETILQNLVLQQMVRSLRGEQNEIEKTSVERGFRERFPAQHRTTDGHWVRSKAEVLIDNWLYMAGIVHAYERQLPIEEEAYCDFYIPAGKVYIEYWGYERDQKYLARKQEKVALYRKYAFNLIELTDDHVKNLDDHLPKLLIKFGVAVS